MMLQTRPRAPSPSPIQPTTTVPPEPTAITNTTKKVFGTGAAMTFFKVGEGKNLGNGIADVGERIWNGLMGTGKGIFNGIKGLFG